jgi:hypothetical protein
MKKKTKPQPVTALVPVEDKDLKEAWKDFKESGESCIHIDLSDIDDDDFLEELERRIDKANMTRYGFKFTRRVAECFDEDGLRDAVSNKAYEDEDFRMNLIADLDVKPHESSEFVNPNEPQMEEKTRLALEALPEIPYNALCDMLRPYLKYTIV